MLGVIGAYMIAVLGVLMSLVAYLVVRLSVKGPMSAPAALAAFNIVLLVAGWLAFSTASAYFFPP